MPDLELEPQDDSPQSEQAEGETQPYRGPERRSGIERRKNGDRRDQVRFDLDGGDRRSGNDRRRGSWKGDERW